MGPGYKAMSTWYIIWRATKGLTRLAEVKGGSDTKDENVSNTRFAAAKNALPACQILSEL